jgi:anti-sigma regulatory factor (Ser/Thr protein kinase)/GAF domain-containing protein
VTGETPEVPDAGELLDRMSDAFFALDDSWRFTYLNERAREIICEAGGTEATVAELRGRSIWDVIPDAEESVFAEQYRTAVETGDAVSFEAEYDPIDTWFEVRAYPSESGLSVYFRDVNGRTEKELQRERHADALRSLYRIDADPDRTFEEKVESALQLGCDYLGIPYGMVNEVGSDSLQVVHAHGTPEDLRPGTTFPREEAYCKRTVERDELAIVDAVADGWADDPAYEASGLACYIGTRMPTEDGVDRTLCFAGPDPRETTFSDTEVTIVELLAQWLTFEFTRQADRRALERKNERLENLASVVSHDLRNPLTIAKARIDFIGEDDTTDEHIAAVSDSLDRIESLVDDLTALARQGDVIDEREVLELDAVVEAAWEGVPTRDATFACETDLAVYADRSRLQQALENLFRNAVEHGGADIHVTVGRTEDGFYVADDGPGIPPEEREKVLRMGYTTADGGSGVGMAIVREVVEAHGWTVTVGESDSGGARFDVTGVDPME